MKVETTKQTWGGYEANVVEVTDPMYLGYLEEMPKIDPRLGLVLSDLLPFRLYSDIVETYQDVPWRGVLDGRDDVVLVLKSRRGYPPVGALLTRGHRQPRKPRKKQSA